MLYLTEADVDRLLDMPTTIAAVEMAFQQLAAGQADNSPRVRVQAPGVVLHSMSAAAPYLGVVGWKQYATTKSGAQFVVGLHDQKNGQLVALIEANRLGQLRTGATTGVAIKHLTNADIEEIGMFGTGWQAESQLTAAAAVRPLKRAFVFGRDAERRRQFAARMSAQLQLEVVPAETPQQAVSQLPVVITATTSRTPVFDGHWLADGTLVCAVGSNWLNKTEVDVTTVKRAARVVCDDIECCRREAGDLVPALEQGLFQWSQAIDLCQIVSGKVSPGQATSENKSGLFKSVGMAIEDVAAAAKLLELVPKHGMQSATIGKLTVSGLN